MTLQEIIAGFLTLPELERDECLTECWRRINSTPAVQDDEFFRTLRSEAALAKQLANLLKIEQSEVARLISEATPTLRRQIVAEVVAEYVGAPSEAAAPLATGPTRPAVRIVGGPSR